MKKVFSFVAVAAMTVALYSCNEAEGEAVTEGEAVEAAEEVIEEAEEAIIEAEEVIEEAAEGEGDGTEATTEEPAAEEAM